MGAGGADPLNIGEQPTTAQGAGEQALFEQTCNFLWNRALVQEGLAWGQLKIAMDQSKVQQLYSSTRRDMVRLVHEAGLGPESTLGGSDLFYMVVNHFFHSELGREFRLPVGALPVHRLNTQGRVCIPQGSSQWGRLHDNVYMESLLLCLMDVSGVAEMAAWLPIHVTRAAIAQAMKNMRRRQVKKLVEWKAQGYDFQQIFYGALYALLEGGLIAGEVRRVRGGHSPSGPLHHLCGSWMAESQPVAAALGFVAGPAVASLSQLCTMQLAQVEVYGTPGDIKALLAVLPCLLENPTAMLEKMWYMQDCKHLAHHCCYCRYGAPARH